jgi:hypothetical protein
MSEHVPNCIADPKPSDALTRRFCPGKPVLCERHVRLLIARAVLFGLYGEIESSDYDTDEAFAQQAVDRLYEEIR